MSGCRGGSDNVGVVMWMCMWWLCGGDVGVVMMLVWW